MKEKDTIRLVESLIIPEITCCLPYDDFSRKETAKLDAMIKKAYKLALGLPERNPHYKLQALGIHNTFEELRETHQQNQRDRLEVTTTGNRVLERYGYHRELKEQDRRG